jgi:subtilase family serine protease
LNISAVDRNNHYVVAQGRVAEVQNAFQVQINRFKVNGEIHRANLNEPTIDGPAKALVASVQGLSDLRYQPYVRRAYESGNWRALPRNSAGIRRFERLVFQR